MKKRTKRRIGMGYGLKKREKYLRFFNIILLYLMGMYLMKKLFTKKMIPSNKKILATKLRFQLNRGIVFVKLLVIIELFLLIGC